MPYIIRPAVEKGEEGFKVCKKENTRKCFSKHPLTKETAEKQRIAIIISEHSRGGNATQEGGKYKVHIGPRGGKYLMVKGVKRYI